MSKDGNVKSVFARFCALSEAIKASVEAGGKKFMFSENLGFLGTCPSNLGTGLRASVMIRLPHLSTNLEELEKMCAASGLQLRGSAGEHSAAVGAVWDLSNTQRIGFSEAQLVQKLIDGVVRIIALEEQLECRRQRAVVSILFACVRACVHVSSGLTRENEDTTRNLFHRYTLTPESEKVRDSCALEKKRR